MRLKRFSILLKAARHFKAVTTEPQEPSTVIKLLEVFVNLTLFLVQAKPIVLINLATPSSTALILFSKLPTNFMHFVTHFTNYEYFGQFLRLDS